MEYHILPKPKVGTVGSKIIEFLVFLLLDPMVNRLCNTERCGNKRHEIVANLTVS